MKKIVSISDTEEDLEETRKKKQKADSKDQIVPLSDINMCSEQIDSIEETDTKENTCLESPPISDESSQDVATENNDVPKPNCKLEDISSPETFNGEKSPLCFSPREDTDSSCPVSKTYSNYTTRNYDDEPYDPEDSLQSYETEYLPDNFVTEDSSSLPVSESTILSKDENDGSSPSVGVVSSVERTSVDVTLEDDAEELVTKSSSPLVSEEGRNDEMRSSMSYYVVREEGEVGESKDIRCSSTEDTVLVMNRDVCSESCEHSQPNLCANDDVTYRDQVNSIGSVDEIVIPARSSVIDRGTSGVPVYPCESNVLKFRRERPVCEVMEREPGIVNPYSGQYSNEYVECPVPKLVCNSVQIPTLEPRPSEPDLYVYNSPVPNMVMCRGSCNDERAIYPMSHNVSEMQEYSFHRVAAECCSSVKSIERTYNEPNSDLCSVIPHVNFEDRGMKIVRKLPSEEDFMRRIEKSLFESKIEPREEGNFLETKYKSEVDLSLPLKKRLRTAVVQREEEKLGQSFPSYPAKPMISIAELEYSLLPRLPPVEKYSFYQDEYKRQI